MKEFLRKNAKIIMTVLSVGLMFVFALPQFRNKSADDIKKSEVGRLNGRKVTQAEMSGYGHELEILNGLRIPNVLDFPETSQVMQDVDPEDRAAYWFLLCQESAKYGHSFLSAQDAGQLAGVSDLDATLRTLQLGQDDFVGIISRLDAVENYVKMVMSVPQPVAQLELMGDRALRKAQVTYADIDGTAGWQESPAPTDAQIKAQFDAYKTQIAILSLKEPRVLNDGVNIYEITNTDKVPSVRIKDASGKILFDGPWSPTAASEVGVPAESVRKVQLLALPGTQPKEINGHHYPFGYKFPDRVSLEWLILKKADIRATIKPTDDDVSKAYRFFLDHPEDVKAMLPATAPASQPGTQPGTQPATQPVAAATMPANGEDPKWNAVKKQLIDTQVESRVQALMNRMRDQITQRLATPWKNGAAPVATWIKYPDLAKILAGTPDFNGYTPGYNSSQRLVTAAEAADLPGIGDSFATLSQGPMPFRLMAVGLKEFDLTEKDNPAVRLNLQRGIEGPVLHDVDGNLYIYRITDAEKTHEPAALDDLVKPGTTIKTQIIEDLKKAATYEHRLQEVKDTIAKAVDVSTLADLYKTKVHTPDTFSRLQAEARTLPLEFAGIRGFTEKVFQIPAPSGGTPSEAVLENDDTMKIAAIRLVQFIDATGIEFGHDRAELLSMPDPQVAFMQSGFMGMSVTVPGPFTQKYMNINAVAQRLKYKPESPFKTK